MPQDLADVAQILATHCCVCGRDLRDAKSVELGIGPVCRRRYLQDPDVPLPEEGWERALGVLAASDLPVHIIDGVLDRRPDTRKAANLIVYWASAHHAHKPTVLDCSNVVRYLGYVDLADKLERDRSDIRFETEGDRIEIFCKRHDDFNRGLRHLGARMERHQSGRFRCWSLPLTAKPALIVLAGVHFGGLQCFADGGIFTIDPRTEADFRALLPKPKARPKGSIPSNIQVFEQDGKLHTHTPYNPAFVSAIRRVPGRRWDGRSNTFPLTQRPTVEALIQQHYGVTP